jgi:hypothetical protein
MLAQYAHQSCAICRKVHRDSVRMSSMHYLPNDLRESKVLSQQYGRAHQHGDAQTVCCYTVTSMSGHTSSCQECWRQICRQGDEVASMHVLSLRVRTLHALCSVNRAVHQSVRSAQWFPQTAGRDVPLPRCSQGSPWTPPSRSLWPFLQSRQQPAHVDNTLTPHACSKRCGGCAQRWEPADGACMHARWGAC